MWRALEAAEVDCHNFTWSGKNSHRARMRAAEELALHLRRLDPDGRGVPLAVVAHSHGGNAALHAVWRIRGQEEQRIRVVTLATPYFFAKDSDAGSKLDTFAAVLVALYFSVLLVVMIVDPGPGVSNPVTMPLVILAFAAIVVQFLGWLFFRFSYGAPGRRDVQEAAIASIQTPEIPEREKVDDLLVIRAADDEAGAVLGAAQFSGWLGFAGARLAKPARLILLLWAASFVLFELDDMGDDFFGSRVAPVYDFLLDWLFPAFATLVLLIALPRIAALAHGWDGPAVTRFAVVTAEASPPGNSRVWQRQIRESRANGLAHSSLYDDPVVIRRVVSHLAVGGIPDASE